jgi:hypothetical protein
MSISRPITAIGGLIVCIGGAVTTVALLHLVIGTGSPATIKTTLKSPTVSAQATETQTQTQTITSTNQYGDRYASGMLPVGDNKYNLTAPTKGSIFLCAAPGSGGGASTRGPWFTNNNSTYDISKKTAVRGSVPWVSNYSATTVSGKRVITTNGLPVGSTTGIFPIDSNDPAYSYDRNPNTIKAQSLSFSFPVDPTFQTSPGCLGGGTIGIMTNGVALFDGFDAEGRDAGAWEIQDSCGGHPQMDGEYHYHTLSSCITDVSSTTVIGFAADGYPITGPTISKGNVITTTDLDECHGMTSSIMLDGKTTNTYHYVMTQDFPYSVSCFKAVSTISFQANQKGPKSQ